MEFVGGLHGWMRFVGGLDGVCRRAGECSCIISVATCEMSASQSGGGIGVVSVTFSLWLLAVF